MKKFVAVLLLAVFMVSLLPMALAKQEGQDPVLTASEDTVAEKNGKALGRAEVKGDVVAQQKERVQNLVAACVSKGFPEDKCKKLFENRIERLEKLVPAVKEKLEKLKQTKDKRLEMLKSLKEDKDLSKFTRELGFKARAIDKIKLDKAKEKFAQVKEKFNQVKQKLEQAGAKLEKAKENKICKDKPDSEECTKAREELRLAAKEKLSSQAEQILENLNKIKSNVEANEALSEEDSAKIIAFIDEKIAAVTAAKAKIDAAQTKEEIVAAAKELANLWGEMKHKVQAYVGHIVNSRMAGIIVKSSQLEAKLERTIERMTENGKDTATVQPLVDSFKEKIVLAKDKFKQSQSLFLEIREDKMNMTGTEMGQKVQEAQGLLKESKAALEEAKSILKEIVAKLREAGAAEELVDATEAEEVEAEAENQEASQTETAGTSAAA